MRAGTQKSSVVYEFTCQCDSGYVGRTTQRFEDRTKQHVPSNIRNKTHPQRERPPRSCKSKITTKTCDSAIGQHLLENPDCAKNYNGDMFRIIGKSRSSFHLAVLESIYISTKKHSIGNTLNRQVALIGQPIQSCARVSDWPISIHNWVCIFLSVEFSIYVLTF